MCKCGEKIHGLKSFFEIPEEQSMTFSSVVSFEVSGAKFKATVNELVDLFRMVSPAKSCSWQPNLHKHHTKHHKLLFSFCAHRVGRPVKVSIKRPTASAFLRIHLSWPILPFLGSGHSS